MAYLAATLRKLELTTLIPKGSFRGSVKGFSFKQSFKSLRFAKHLGPYPCSNMSLRIDPNSLNSCPGFWFWL